MRIKTKSLQAELYRWILASTLVVLLVASIVSGGIVFFKARELQDNTLREISLLLRAGKLTPPETSITLQSELNRLNQTAFKPNASDKLDIEEDTTVILFEIKPDSIRKKQHNFLFKKSDGFDTIQLLDEKWRALIVTLQRSDRKFLIAQPTELRDEIALSSAASTLYPILFFAAGLLILIHFVLKKKFSTIKQLSQSLDEQDGTHLEKLSDENAPSEIQPFIRSINALMKRVQTAMEKQQRFIADAAHELRTPIAALSLQTENLNNAGDEQERSERLSALQQGFLRLGKLVGQLLDLARLQAKSDAIDVKLQSVSLNETVKQVIQDLYPIAEKGQVDIGVIRQDEKIQVNDHNGLLIQLIQNAIANAIHYTPENGEVNISLFKENNRAVLLIEDTGCGIPEDELDKVIEPFYRVLNTGKKGNGLGLTISQEIADKLGGKILLTNRKSGGLIYRYEQIICDR